jgi:hypothetical protein
MAKHEHRWVRVRTLSQEEKGAIAATCGQFVDTVLKPRFLPKVQVTQFNYPIDIFGKWRGTKYSFITRFRSGHADNVGEEFDSAFTRLDFVEESVSEICFDVMWHRHTGQWWRLHSSVPLEDALRLIESEELLQPL